MANEAAYCCVGLLFLVLVVFFAFSMRTNSQTRKYCQQSGTDGLTGGGYVSRTTGLKWVRLNGVTEAAFDALAKMEPYQSVDAAVDNHKGGKVVDSCPNFADPSRPNERYACTSENLLCNDGGGWVCQKSDCFHHESKNGRTSSDTCNKGCMGQQLINHINQLGGWQNC
jgi:hypothetical protein